MKKISDILTEIRSDYVFAGSGDSFEDGYLDYFDLT